MEEGTLEPLYVHSSENAADGLTKALPRPAHELSMRRLLGVQELPKHVPQKVNMLLEAHLLNINPHCM